ncbi:MAG TPA: hypothetical protein VGB87_23735, partial [Vicinamibacteria bacterium]
EQVPGPGPPPKGGAGVGVAEGGTGVEGEAGESPPPHERTRTAAAAAIAAGTAFHNVRCIIGSLSSNTVHLIVVIEQPAGPETRALPPALARPPRTAPGSPKLVLAAGAAALAVLAVLGAEVAARGLAPDYLVRTRGLHVFSETLGWAPREGVSAVVEGQRVTLNARGYRGRELALPRPRERARLVVLGDSIAFGLGVSDEETFTSLLDGRDNGIEAGNLAVQGYDPGQELLVLLGEGLRSEPDVVVLAFCLANDFAEPLLPVALYDGRTPKPRFRLAGDRLVLDRSSLVLTRPERLVLWLSDRSHLFNRVSSLGPRSEGSAPRHWRDRKREALRDEEYAIRLSLEIVRRMDAACRERGIAFVLAVFPNRSSYPSKSWLAGRFLESARAEGIAVLDVSERFLAQDERFGAVTLDDVGHLSPRGHSITAEVLEAEITGLLGGRLASSSGEAAATAR